MGELGIQVLHGHSPISSASLHQAAVLQAHVGARQGLPPGHAQAHTQKDPALGISCSVVAILKLVVILCMNLYLISKI